MENYYVDFQCHYKNDGSYCIKELCILQDTDEIKQFLFKPPHDYDELDVERKRSEFWNVKNKHGLSWNSGVDEPVALTWLIIDKKRVTIYCKGDQKKKTIQNQFEQASIINVENLGCPSFKELEKTYNNCKEKCKFHNTFNFDCAKNNALMLKKWIVNTEKNCKETENYDDW
jgi:hypothetical protein